MTATPASTPALTIRELLDYTAAETERWHRWFTAHPAQLLDVPVGEGRTATVRGLVQHIIAVERRYADRLLGDAVTPYEAIPTDSADALFAAFTQARARLERYLATATPDDLARRLEFQTLSAGAQSASARKIVLHALVHGIRHWAQVASALRQHGHATDWMHDLLMSDALT